MGLSININENTAEIKKAQLHYKITRLHASK